MIISWFPFRKFRFALAVVGLATFPPFLAIAQPYEGVEYNATGKQVKAIDAIYAQIFDQALKASTSDEFHPFVKQALNDFEFCHALYLREVNLTDPDDKTSEPYFTKDKIFWHLYTLATLLEDRSLAAFTDTMDSYYDREPGIIEGIDSAVEDDTAQNREFWESSLNAAIEHCNRVIGFIDTVHQQAETLLQSQEDAN